MKLRLTSKKLIPVALATMALTLGACGSSDDEATTSTTEGSMMTTTTAAGDSAKLTPVGSACSQVPTSGEGSVEGMSDDPVATAASNNPLLTTLVTAVGAAGLGDTLNGAGPFTVFAPLNSAFEKVPAADLQALLADKAKLTDVLTYHVVPGRYTSAQLTDGQQLTTVEGKKITIKKSGDTIKANDATVGCADVPVANGVVYLIDSVLMPAAS